MIAPPSLAYRFPRLANLSALCQGRQSVQLNAAIKKKKQKERRVAHAGRSSLLWRTLTTDIVAAAAVQGSI